MAAPRPPRIKRECVEMAFTTNEQDKHPILVIESIPPLDMITIAKRLPGEFLKTIEMLQAREKSKKEERAPENPEQEIRDAELLYLHSRTILERAVVGMLDDENGELVPMRIRFEESEIDEGTIDGRALHLLEVTSLAFRALEIAGWGGGLAERVGTFRVWEYGGRPGRGGDVAVRERNGSEAAPAARVSEPVSPAGDVDQSGGGVGG